MEMFIYQIAEYCIHMHNKYKPLSKNLTFGYPKLLQSDNQTTVSRVNPEENSDKGKS